MGYYPVKIRKSDRLFSRWIRSIGHCEICGRNDIKLEAAHFFSRGKENTRFDRNNVHCLCFNCHKKAHEDNNYYKDWLIEKLGQKGFDLLELSINLYKKRDDKIDLIIINEQTATRPTTRT